MKSKDVQVSQSVLNQPKAVTVGGTRTYHAASTRNDSARGIEVFKTRMIVSIDQSWAAPREKTSNGRAKAITKSEAPITVTRGLQGHTARITVPA